MKNLSIILLAVLISLSASSQRVYFVYVQTDNGSPFYVKLGDKILSSTTPGYLILSNLRDSTYQLVVGFPSSPKEYKYRVVVGAKDRGFVIKDIDGGSSLFDLQTLSLIRPEVQEVSTTTYKRRDDNFTSLLSRAANDTSLLWVAVAARQEIVVAEKVENVASKDTEAVAPDLTVAKIPEPSVVKPAAENTGAKNFENTLPKVFDPPIIAVDSTVVKVETDARTGSDSVLKTSGNTISQQDTEQRKTDTVSISTVLEKTPVAERAVIEEPVEEKPAEVFKKSIVKKYSESSTSEGFGLVFHDRSDSGIDTIRLIIPNPKIAIKNGSVSEEDSTGFLQLAKNDLPKVKEEEVKKTEDKSLPVVGNCQSTATDADFLKLRKNMAARTTDEDMVAEAKKYFKNKCFSTGQVKNLAALFLTSAGKYQFFDAAYFHVTDPSKFKDLAAEISDDYYLRRFKALTGE